MPFEPCQNIHSILSNFDKKWFICGGWAIDLYLERETRVHNDIEIGVFREEQRELKHFLNEWNIKKVVDGEFVIWENEFLELPIHELHAIHKNTGQRFEILLNERNETNWLFRRDIRISHPIDSFFYTSRDGIPYLKPEIVLLYKAKTDKTKDGLDFYNAIDYLDNKSKEWLKQAIEIHQPGHEWLHCL